MSTLLLITKTEIKKFVVQLLNKQTDTMEFYLEIKGWNIDTCKNASESQDYYAK